MSLYYNPTMGQTNTNVDSLKQAMAKKRDSMIQENQRKLDSIKSANEYRLDSITKAREKFLDSIRIVRERRADSLDALKRYRNSRRYRDSVEAVKQAFQDSIKAIRLERMDSIKIAQQKFQDSLLNVREHIRDSVQASIQARKDSMMEIREQKLAEIESRKSQKSQQTEEERKKEAMAEEHEKEKEAYDNKKFLKKKWRFPRSALQNTYTRYNYYYNADMQFNSMMDNIYKQQKTNYDSLISVYRIDPETSSRYAGSSPTEIIKKASLDIQMHDPRSKWQDDLYYLIAESYYVQQDMDKAVPYLKFIIQNFNEDKSAKKKSGRKKQLDVVQKVKDKDGKTKRVLVVCTEEPTGLFAKFKHRPIRNDALMLLARAFSDEGYSSEALSLVTQMENDINFPARLQGQANILKTQIYMSEKSYAQAQEFLDQAIESTKSKKELARLYFLRAQLYEYNDQLDSAYYVYEKVDNPNADIDISLESKYKMTDIIYDKKWQDQAAPLIRNFQKMSKEEKYADNLGAIYFNLGQLEIVEGNGDEAEQYFTQSISASTDPESKNKAISQLVNFYYQDHNYVKADYYYDQLDSSAGTVDVASMPDGDVLDTLAYYQSVWQHNDSLFYLASLSSSDQKKWAKQMYAQEKLSSSSDGFQKLQPNQSSSSSSSSNFYFANTSVMQKGEKEFIRIWGPRKDEDNWAIKSLTKFNPGSTSTDVIAQTGGKQNNSNGLEGEEKYLSMIPQNSDEVYTLNFGTQQAIYNLGTLHYQKLNDPRQANVYFDTLLAKYPNSEYRPRALFNLYVTSRLIGDSSTAMTYKKILENQYAGSYQFLFEDYVEGDKAQRKDTASQVYGKMYALFEEKKYPEVITFYSNNEMFLKDFEDYQHRADLLRAQSYAGMGNYNEALTTDEKLISDEPQQDIKEFAIELRRLLRNRLNMQVESVDSTADTPDPRLNLDRNGKSSLVLQIIGVEDAEEYKIMISNFNSNFYPTDKFQISDRYTNDGTIYIRIKGFDNYDQARKYSDKLQEQEEAKLSNPDQERPIFIINDFNISILNEDEGFFKYLDYFKTHF